MRRVSMGLFVVALLSIPVWAPLLHPGFIQTHSGLGAAYDLLDARTSGPLAWLPTGGTPGDGPLATWLALLLRTVGLGPLAALTVVYAAGFLVSGIAMYLLARPCWGEAAALAAASVYMYIPYRLVVVYVRGALAESVVLGLAPLLCLAMVAALADERTGRGTRRAPKQRSTGLALWVHAVRPYGRLAAVAFLCALLVLANPGLGLVYVGLCLLCAAVLLMQWPALTPPTPSLPPDQQDAWGSVPGYRAGSAHEPCPRMNDSTARRLLPIPARFACPVLAGTGKPPLQRHAVGLGRLLETAKAGFASLQQREPAPLHRALPVAGGPSCSGNMNSAPNPAQPATDEITSQASVGRSVPAALLLACAIGVLVGVALLLPAGGRLFPRLPSYSDHFVHVYQLFAGGWGFGESGAAWHDGLSFQLGVVAVALAVVALRGVWPEGMVSCGRVLLLWAMLAGVLFLMLTPAALLWRVLSLSALLAYPWQLLGPAAFLLALLAGAAGEVIVGVERFAPLQGGKVLYPYTTAAVLLAAVALGSYSYLAPRYLDAGNLPDLSHPPLARLGDDILLLDARLDTETTAGGTVHLTLIWQAVRQPAADYTIFAHLIDAQGVKRGQQDVRPGNGAHPTNAWLPGEVVRDDVTVPVAADAAPGAYVIHVGMYLLATMERLPVAGSAERQVVVGPLVVR